MSKSEKKQANKDEQNNPVKSQGQTEKSEDEAKIEDPKNELQIKLDEAQEELKKQKELLLRTAAEYDNYRKRTEREKSCIYVDATVATVGEFLVVADNLERALKQEDCSAEDMHKGVKMVNAQLTGALGKLDVTAMGKVGEAFNPDLHNAVSHVDDDSVGENTIIQVLQKGYKIGDKIVRHAMVQVAN